MENCHLSSLCLQNDIFVFLFLFYKILIPESVIHLGTYCRSSDSESWGESPERPSSKARLGLESLWNQVVIQALLKQFQWWGNHYFNRNILIYFLAIMSFEKCFFTLCTKLCLCSLYRFCDLPIIIFKFKWINRYKVRAQHLSLRELSHYCSLPGPLDHIVWLACWASSLTTF